MAVIIDLADGALAFVVFGAVIAAGAGVHRADKHEVGGIALALFGARNGDGFVLEWLAQGLKEVAVEFG